ncbi:MAG TPA: hypothetical protein VMI31_16270, partial [Fimbriimonadaceae bacterium]|nr:hypothetical protein [Fimbriimonadaceae bacterium]
MSTVLDGRLSRPALDSPELVGDPDQQRVLTLRIGRVLRSDSFAPARWGVPSVGMMRVRRATYRAGFRGTPQHRWRF